jgi:lauroyl/myristoyl acyltransferase
MQSFRGANGVRGIAAGSPGAIAEALRALRRNEVVGILVDLPARGARGLAAEVTFLGSPASCSRLVEVLARRTGAAVLAGTIGRSPIDPCQHAISVSAVDGNDPSQAMTAILEAAVRRDPTQWLWSLDRFRGSTSRSPRLSRGIASCIPAAWL